MYYTFDRIEGKLAVLVCDDGTVLSVSPSLLSDSLRAGDVYISSDGKAFDFCEAETDARRKKALSLHHRLFGSAKK